MGGKNKRLLTMENKLKVDGGRWRGGCTRWVMDIKGGTCCDEHWVLYVSDESLNSTPETDMTLYVNWNLNKNLKHKK